MEMGYTNVSVQMVMIENVGVYNVLELAVFKIGPCTVHVSVGGCRLFCVLN